MSDVLVVYVDPSGPTAQVAMTVAEQLCRHGLDVELRRVERAGTSGHSAVVLGGATGPTQWHPAALAYLRRVQPGCPVHLFHTGFGGPDPVRVPAEVVAFARARGIHDIPVLLDEEPLGADGPGWPDVRKDPARRWAGVLAGRLGAPRLHTLPVRPLERHGGAVPAGVH